VPALPTTFSRGSDRKVDSDKDQVFVAEADSERLLGALFEVPTSSFPSSTLRETPKAKLHRKVSEAEGFMKEADSARRVSSLLERAARRPPGTKVP
jgi:hypothetical protein